MAHQWHRGVLDTSSWHGLEEVGKMATADDMVGHTEESTMQTTDTMSTVANAFAVFAAALEPLLPLSEGRRESLRIATEAGAPMATLTKIAAAHRCSRKATIVLPPHRLEKLSRGKGWARKGKGDKAEWGERVKDGYEVGPGRWVVGGNDGFNRNGEDQWTVEYVSVGAETWTLAS